MITRSPACIPPGGVTVAVLEVFDPLSPGKAETPTKVCEMECTGNKKIIPVNMAVVIPGMVRRRVKRFIRRWFFENSGRRKVHANMILINRMVTRYF